MLPTSKPTSSSATESYLLKASWFSFFLTLVKFAGYAATGSINVLTTALDSFGDTLTSWLNSRMQRLAHKDPDAEHPFGHSGYDVVNGLVQGTVLLGIGIFLSQEIIRDFLVNWHGNTENMTVETFYKGGIVLVIATVGGFTITRFLKIAEKKLHKQGHRSLSMSADIAHYTGDMYANAFQAVGFVASFLLKANWLENAFAAVGVVFLIKSAWNVLRASVNDIMQTDETKTFKERLIKSILASDSRIKNVHRLRVRSHGVKRFVDFHMTLPENLTLRVAHEIGERAEKAVAPLIPQAEILVHVDPDSFPVEPDFDV